MSSSRRLWTAREPQDDTVVHMVTPADGGGAPYDPGAIGMDAGTSRELMGEYLAALQRGGDFAHYFTEDVRWTTAETGDELQGRDAVRDYIIALHTQALDAHMEVRNLVVGDGGAVLEADLVGTHTGEFAGIPATGARLRVPYAVAYDLSPDGITALRAYVPVAHMINQLREAQSAS